MRILGKIEKELMREMEKTKAQGIFLPNILEKYLENERIEVDLTNQTVEIIFEQAIVNKNQNYIINKSDYIQEVILRLVYLIELLEKEGYILLYKPGQHSNNINFGQLAVNVPSVPMPIPDQAVEALMVKYVAKAIIFTEEASVFIKKKFVARDERWKRRGLCATWAGIVLAFSVSFASILIQNKKVAENNVLVAQSIEKVKLIQSNLEEILRKENELIGKILFFIDSKNDSHNAVSNNNVTIKTKSKKH